MPELDLTPSAETPPEEAYYRLREGFISYREYAAYRLSREDAEGFRIEARGLAGPGADGLPDADLALAYHDAMCRLRPDL